MEAAHILQNGVRICVRLGEAFGTHIQPVDGELQNWPKATWVMWSNNVTEGNRRLVF